MLRCRHSIRLKLPCTLTVFNMSKLFSYRPDIDGLRAVAVLLVIFYHAKMSAISGGFIGVDVFFVLSGFLITIIIAKEHAQDRFSYGSFYLRRIRRLMPALVFLLLVCCIPAYFILFPDDFERFSRTLIHSFIATNNFHLWLNTGNYFSPNTDLIPLLHTWSLAVEEQFYFIWPAMFIFMASRFSKTTFFKINAVLLVSFLGLSIYLTQTTPHSAYFLLPARAFELMMGAMLAIGFLQLPHFKQNTNHGLSIIGLILVVVPALTLTKASSFPGLNAFWPCLGTVLLIISGKDQNTMGIINRALSIRPIVFIGLLSYSLYLWHWPIFVFFQYLGLELVGLVQLLALVLVAIFSYISWRFVEQPMRNAHMPTLKAGLKKVVLPSFIVLTVIYGVIDGKNGFPHRFQDLAEYDKKKNFPSTVRKRCFDADKIGNIEECWLGVKKEKLDGLLIGDSFANHTASFLDVLAKDAGLFIHDSTSGGHPLLTRLIAPDTYDYPPQYAVDRLKYAMQFDNIYLAANWDIYSNPTDINYEFLLDTIGKIVSAGKNVYVFSSLQPTTKMNLHRLKLLKASDYVFFDEYDATLKREVKKETHLITVMQRRYPSIHFIHMTDIMCTDIQCQLQLDDIIVYRNNDHLNTSGAALIAQKYLEKFGNPIKQNSLQETAP